MEKFFNKYYKILLVIPIILTIISMVYIGVFYEKNNDLFKKDVSLSGGVTLSLYTDKSIDIKSLEDVLKDKFPKSDLFIRKLSEFGTDKQIGIIIEASEVKGDELKDFISKKLDFKFTETNYSLEEMGSSLGENFYKQMLFAILLAYVFMGIVIFIRFKDLIPSLTIISTTSMDIIITIAIINLIGMRLGTAGIAAILMLIGYGADTNILMTTKVIKRRTELGTFFERIKESAKTGLTMTGTTIVALSIALLFTNNSALTQIFTIIIIGCLIDILTTYGTDAGILKWYCKRKGWE